MATRLTRVHLHARRAAALVTVPALLLCGAGCSGGDGRNDRGEDKSARSAGSEPARTKLQQAALAPADLTGYQISAQSKDPSAPAGQPQADERRCQPLADIMGDKPDPAARETVNRGIGSQKQLGLAISASLSSYSTKDAKRLVEQVRSAVAACSEGFSARVGKQTGSYRDIKELPYEAGGDDSVSWTTTAAAEGVSAPVHIVVVRTGDTIARFMALNVAAQQRTAEVPHEITDKQLEKLARVLG
ncbi:hypothetical protein [Streptomyces sp. NPDC006879]|uniref:hypothetical protein n=1 Tax=Streptomyces sp. NPDC006879 TaxID=3364767 RepID=UPI0036BF6C5B